jgi:carbon monoxide dehydrogenase subunit G
MLHFEGDKTFSRPLAEVWARLTDAGFLLQCIPNVAKVTAAEGDRAVFTVRPGLGFISGNLDVEARIADKVEPGTIRYLLHSKGIGSSSTVETVLSLQPSDQQTKVHWVADVKELGGLLKLVPSGLIRGAGQKVISDLWDQVEAKMTA